MSGMCFCCFSVLSVVLQRSGTVKKCLAFFFNTSNYWTRLWSMVDVFWQISDIPYGTKHISMRLQLITNFIHI